MTLCINPNCNHPQNPDTAMFCLSCGTDLLLDGQYRVIKKLGGGGFGYTYAVDHRGTAKLLKLLYLDDPHVVKLFKQEAEVLGKLNHPGIPKVDTDGYFTVFPRGSNQPLHCIVMEKIIGQDLGDWLQQRGQPISQKNALDWLKQLVEILDLVHSQQFFHRDIKPPNIMLRSNGQLVLIDFGTVREITATYVARQQAGLQGTIVYSQGYAPNEQLLGRTVPQSDFFALGRTFVHLLTGQHPLNFCVQNSFKWRSAVPNLSPIFADFLDELMAERPEHRPANTQVILQRLQQVERQLSGSNINTKSTLVATPQKTTIKPINRGKNRLIILLNILVGSGAFILFIWGVIIGDPLFSGQSKTLKEKAIGASLAFSSMILGVAVSLIITNKLKFEYINGIVISPNNQFLLISLGFDNNQTKVFNLATGQELYTIYTDYIVSYSANFAFANNGHQIVFINKKEIKLFSYY